MAAGSGGLVLIVGGTTDSGVSEEASTPAAAAATCPALELSVGLTTDSYSSSSTQQAITALHAGSVQAPAFTRHRAESMGVKSPKLSWRT